MSLDNASSGPSNASEFLVSGLPWVTSSVVSGISVFQFDYLSKGLLVKNASGAGDVKVAFTQAGITTNYFLLSSGQSFSEDIRCTRVYVSGSGNTISVLAGLTQIPVRHFPHLTGSIWSGVG